MICKGWVMLTKHEKGKGLPEGRYNNASGRLGRGWSRQQVAGGVSLFVTERRPLVCVGGKQICQKLRGSNDAYWRTPKEAGRLSDVRLNAQLGGCLPRDPARRGSQHRP
eukprot:EG_transcript_55337